MASQQRGHEMENELPAYFKYASWIISMREFAAKIKADAERIRQGK